MSVVHIELTNASKRSCNTIRVGARVFSPKEGTELPSCFPGLFPLMQSLECIKLFDVVIFFGSFPPSVNFGGNTA